MQQRLDSVMYISMNILTVKIVVDWLIIWKSMIFVRLIMTGENVVAKQKETYLGLIFTEQGENKQQSI